MALSVTSIKENQILLKTLSHHLLQSEEAKLVVTCLSDVQQGLQQQNFVLTREGQEDTKFLLRLYLKQGVLETRYLEEFKILTWICEQGYDFCPRVLYHDWSEKMIPLPFIVEEFIQGTIIGTMAFKPGYQTEEVLQKLVDALLKIHKVPRDPSTLSDVSKLLIIDEEKTKTNFLVNSQLISENFQKRSTQIWEQIETTLKPREEYFRNIPRDRLIHGDAHFGNILIRNNQNSDFFFIDWEAAGTGNPLEDLGVFLATNAFIEPEKENFFLRSYGFDFNNPDNVRVLWLFKMRKYVMVISYFCNSLKEISEGKRQTSPEMKANIGKGAMIYAEKCAALLASAPLFE